MTGRSSGRSLRRCGNGVGEGAKGLSEEEGEASLGRGGRGGNPSNNNVVTTQQLPVARGLRAQLGTEHPLLLPYLSLPTAL